MPALATMLRMGLPAGGAGRQRVGGGEGGAAGAGPPSNAPPPEDPAREAERRAARDASRKKAEMEAEAAKLEVELAALKKDLDERARLARLGEEPPAAGGGGGGEGGGGAATERLNRRPAAVRPRPPQTARTAPRREARGPMAKRIERMERLARERGLVAGSGADGGRASKLSVRRDDPEDERQMFATYYRTMLRLPTPYRRQARGV